MDTSALHTFLTIGYGAAGLFTIAGYIPQYLEFKRNPRSANTSPLAMWALWTIQALLVFAYAAVVNGDIMFILSGAFSALVNIGVMAMVVSGRLQSATLHTRATDTSPAAVLPISNG